MAGEEPGTRCQPTRTAPAGLGDGVHGVPNQVDQQLLELVGIALNGQRRAGGDLDVVRFLERRHAIDEASMSIGASLGCGSLARPRMRTHEPAERFRARGDHVEASLHVFAPVGRGHPAR